MKWFAGVGVFSYSLYLTHEIVEWHAWPLAARLLVNAGIGLPHIVVAGFLLTACLIFARAFFQVFERPFLSRSRAAAVQPVVAA